MHAIKRLDNLTPHEIRELAHAAADRGEPHETANPYEFGTANHLWFQTYYSYRQAELSPA